MFFKRDLNALRLDASANSRFRVLGLESRVPIPSIIAMRGGGFLGALYAKGYGSLQSMMGAPLKFSCDYGGH